MDLTYEKIKRCVEGKGYQFFTSELSVNRIGIRKENKITNLFDDTFVVAFVENGIPRIWSFDDFTTDPGFYYSKEKLLNEKGVAILKAGQYRGMHTFGKHRGKYDAMVQCRECTVYRDRNKDGIIDLTSEDTGIFGINEHHAYNRDEIGKYSAGCQVHKTAEQLKVLLSLYKRSADLYGDLFTYTLLEEKDFR